jgi:uncharacterized phiE125 gp8 family phage protein
MPNILLTGPAVEPLTLAEAKEFLRVDIADDDDLIASLVVAARIHVEAATRRALISQTWRLVFDCWPGIGRIGVRPAPLRSITAARVYDSSGASHSVDLQAFIADTAASAIAFAPWSLPLPGRIAAGIEIDVTVGYGDAASDVPAPLIQAIRLLVAHWYENRRVTATTTEDVELPMTVSALIAPYRMLSL